MMKVSITALLCLSSLAVIAEENPVLEGIQEYLEFAEYADGAITPEQVSAVGSENFSFIDVRNPKRFNAGHIPGAVNIEWRQILERRQEIPESKPVIVYCDTGLSSSKASFILRLAGYENVNVLRGGYMMWKQQQP